MAGLVRIRALQSLTRNMGMLTKKQNLCRTIGTSPKKNESEVANSSDKELYPANKNWVSWGFNYEDKRVDRYITHESFFFSITICMVLTIYYYMFLPNYKAADWAQREAYLELRRRESLGLPPIDKDYFDPETIYLPTDEELGDTEIII